MAVRFDAASDRCTWTGTAPTPSSGLTITFWAYVSVDRDDSSTMIRLHSASGATTNINVAMDTSGLLPCVFTAGGTSTGPQALSVGVWARIAVTVTGSTSTIYTALDAAGATQSQAGTVGSNAGVAPDSGYTVGGRAANVPDEWYNGRLAHLRIWSSVLTQAEIEAEWASPAPVRTSLLFADYPLTDATDLADHSGNARHLAAGSTAVSTEDGPPISTTVTGTVAAELPALASAAAGGAVAGGQVAGDLPGITSAAGGVLLAGGQLAADAPGPELAGAGGVETAGQLGAALPALDTELAGTSTVTGTAPTTLPSPTVALSGSVATPVVGTLAATLPGLTMASGRVDWPPAVTDVPLAALIGVDGPHDVPWIAVE